MRSETVAKRLDLLKKIGEGYNQRETVKYLVEKYGLTEAGAYYHFRTKEKWIGQYARFDRNYAFTVRQRYDQLYREAAFQYKHCQDTNGKIWFLRCMIEANNKCAEYLPDTKGEGAINMAIRWNIGDYINKGEVTAT